jgi:ABC-type polysaccharide/polyol phosphate transport system ATPase subunit
LPSESDLLIPPGVSIRVEDVKIRYRTTFESQPTLRSAFLRLGRRRQEGPRKGVRIVEAVKGVSFDVANGTVLGLVGANGAGKSTLMRAMAGILPPSEGRIIVNGRVSTLLALGVGFNGALSGRENVILGGLAAGLTVEQVQEKFEEIADFADLPDGFIDMPMRTYSSGMYGRLAFAVSVNMEPDILLVDEALSTGDAAFKEKSMDKMRELVSEARTIVIVSHALGTIQELCNHAVWLHKGEMIQAGEPHEVTEAYMKFLKVGESAIALEDI